MSSSPLRMVGAMVIEIGGVLLALAVLPGLPWEQWKASLASAAHQSIEAAELPPSLPPSTYGFQLDGQTRQLQERAYTQHIAPPPAAPQSRTFAAPPAMADQRTAVVTEGGRPTNILPQLPPEPQRREYVADRLDRASQQILDSLAGPWSGRSDSSAGVTERELASRSQGFRAPPTRTAQTEQQYLRPEYPSSLPKNTVPAPTTRFGNPSPAQPLERTQTFAAPPIPLEPTAPKFQSDIAPQSYTTPNHGPNNAPNYGSHATPNNASNQVSPPPSYYAPPRTAQYEGETASYERPPISNQYYAPRTNTAPPTNLTGPAHARPTGPRHVQY